MTDTRYALCTICDASCGLAVQVEGNRVVSIRGDEENLWSRGHICPKATALKEVHEDPDRLRQPMRRVGSRWSPMPWDEAIAFVAERFVDIQRRHGRDATAVYYGNPVGHSHQSLVALLAVMKLAGTRNIYSSGSVDAHPRMLVSRLLFGNQALLPVPDIRRTDFLVIMGANPLVSNGSVMSTSDVKAHLRDLRARGGRIVVIDPRRTETAAIADEHHFIRPGTDALLLLATLHVLFAEQRIHPDAARIGSRLDVLRALCLPYSPERVAARTGLAPDAIRTLARAFADARSAAWYGRMGTCTQDFGCVTTWLIDAVNIVAGHFDRAGGLMFTTPAADLAGLARWIREPGRFDRWRSRVTGLPEFNGEFPVPAMADEMETAGEGQIRALWTIAGNPVLSIPNGRRIDRCLERLEFMASIDFYINETTRHANVILPPTTALENDHYPLLELSMATRNVALFAPAVLARDPESRSDAEIMLEVLAGMSRARSALGAPLAVALKRFARALERGHVLDGLLRVGPHRLRLRRLRRLPHGLDLGPLQPRLRDVILTPDARIDLAPELLVRDLNRLEASLALPTPTAPGDFLLVSRRTLRSMNSWLHNAARMVSGKPRCTLEMHPDDAHDLAISNGDRVAIRTRVAEIQCPVEITDAMMRGVVSLPFGWGHDREGTRLSVARGVAGVSFNDVADERLFDAVNGTSVVDGVPVTVTRVA